ncbi:MAG: flagellar motor switch protein FliG [Thermodesulfobacteriota bacterium]|nr:flagellar motor switch protein FliG [Thermodesulfobacteriota bacterium]
MSPSKNTEGRERLSGAKKAAIFLLMMGEEYASRVFKKLSDEEIKRIASAMAEIDQVDPDEGNRVAEEFLATFQEKGTTIIKSDKFLSNVIASSLDKKKAQEVFKEIEDARRDKPFSWTRNVNLENMVGYIKNEHPQTIAMILAYLPVEISSDIFSLLPDSQKGDIAVRIARLGQVPEDVIRNVDDAMRLELMEAGARSSKAGGMQLIADILNSAGKASEESVMEFMEEEHGDMAEEIRQMMFVFEDLATVDDRAMREILKKVESSQLTLALKTSSEELKQKITSNLSSRAVEMLMEDLEVMGPVKLSSVEAAQQQIVNAAKELEAEGTITLGGGKEDVLV